MKLSIVVCTYGRYDIIDETIDSILSSASNIKCPLELLVVDNNPPESKKKIRIVKSAQIKVVDEYKTGLSNARNKGVTEASGDVILFNDDDIYATEGYLNYYYEFFKTHPRVDVAGGKTVPHYEDLKPDWIDPELEKYLSLIDYGNKARPIKSGEYLVGANIAFRKTVFDKYGLFNVALGRQGATGLLSNEETDFVAKLPGYPYYLPGAAVKHRIFPERLLKSWFKKRVSWQAISDFAGKSGPAPEQIKYEISQLDALEVSPNFLEKNDAEIFRHELRKIYLETYRLITGN